MSAPYNQFPTPEPTSSEHQMLVGYDDGNVAQMFNQRGDRIELSVQEGADDTERSAVDMLVKAGDGNVFVLTQGIIFNAKTRGAASLADLAEQTDEGIPGIVIGQTWKIPGFGTSTPVTEVLLSCENAPEGPVDEQRPSASPWEKVQAIGEQVRAELDAIRRGAGRAALGGS